jgi:hypothetical protein
MNEAGAHEFALEAAKQVVIAKASNTNIPFNADGGASVGNFYEELYKKIFELAKKT